MNPDNLPSNTEYAASHFYQPHPFLYPQSAFCIQPILPVPKQKPNYPKPAELRESQESPTTTPRPNTRSQTTNVRVTGRTRGRPKGSKKRV